MVAACSGPQGGSVHVRCMYECVGPTRQRVRFLRLDGMEAADEVEVVDGWWSLPNQGESGVDAASVHVHAGVLEKGG